MRVEEIVQWANACYTSISLSVEAARTHVKLAMIFCDLKTLLVRWEVETR